MSRQLKVKSAEEGIQRSLKVKLYLNGDGLCLEIRRNEDIDVFARDRRQTRGQGVPGGVFTGSGHVFGLHHRGLAGSFTCRLIDEMPLIDSSGRFHDPKGKEQKKRHNQGELDQRLSALSARTRRLSFFKTVTVQTHLRRPPPFLLKSDCRYRKRIQRLLLPGLPACCNFCRWLHE